MAQPPPPAAPRLRRLLPKPQKKPDKEDEDEDEPVRARKRIRVACRFCRHRKMKCDGLHPSCTTCLRRKEVCTYLTTMQEEALARDPDANGTKLEEFARLRARGRKKRSVKTSEGEGEDSRAGSLETEGDKVKEEAGTSGTAQESG